jgi:polar amino acid transport system substrate-binding protein
LKANVVTTGFDTIINSLGSKRFDVVISAVSITDERKQKVDFVPYFTAGESLLVPKGNPKSLKLAAELCGFNVAVQDGTIEQAELVQDSAACKKAGKPEIKLTVLKNQTDVVASLATNRVDATYQDSPVTDYYLKQHAGQFDVGGSVFSAALEGIVVRKGDAPMFNAVQAAFNSLKADGTYTKLINQWGLKTGAITEVDTPKKIA